MVPTFGLKIYRTGKFRLGQHHVMLNMHYQIKYPKYKNKCFFIFVEMERLRTVWTFLSPACKRVYSYKFWACSQRKQCTSIFILKNHFMYVAFFIWSFLKSLCFFYFWSVHKRQNWLKMIKWQGYGLNKTKHFYSLKRVLVLPYQGKLMHTLCQIT